MSYRSQFVAGLLLLVPAFAGANNEIIVSAPRLDDLDLMDVTVAADVTVIDQATVEQSGAVSVPELLQSEANVLVRGREGTRPTGSSRCAGLVITAKCACLCWWMVTRPIARTWA